MNDNWEYLNIELVYNNEIINVNSIPKIVFNSEDNLLLIVTINDIFNNMINEILRVGDPSLPINCSVWESVNIYLSIEDQKINLVNKTKLEMNQYPSYGEGIFEIYNYIISI